MVHRLLTLLLPIFFLSPTIAAAQNGAIEGTVIEDATGAPLPGVNVLVEDLNLGAATNPDGRFLIEEVPAGEQTVTVRFVGYTSQSKNVTVTAGQTAVVNFSLASAPLDLEEVIITGTGGEVSREKLGTSISSIKAQQVQEIAPISDFGDLLEGRATGVRSTATSGTVGGGKDLRIRGTSSFTLGQRPAVYLDGVRIDTRQADWAGGGTRFFQEFSGGQGTDRLSDLSPDEIERVEIVKGAAAAMLYGSEASNGVIQIFTRKGRLNSPPRWSLNVTTGINRHRENFPTTLFSDFEGPDGFRARDANNLIENGLVTTTNLSVGGGGDDVSYFISGGISSEEGSLQPNWMRKGNLRMNLEWFVSDEWTFSVTSGYARSRILEQQAGNNWNALLGNAVLGNPRVATEERPFGEPWTSIEAIQSIEAFTDAQRFTGGLTVRYAPMEDFTHRLIFGLDAVGEDRERFLPFDYDYVYVPSGERNLFHRNFRNWTVDYLGQYSLDVTDNISTELSWGTQGFWESERIGFSIGRGFAGPGVSTVGGGSTTFGNESFQEVVTLGVFGQNRLSIADKLFVTAGFRADGNSAFGTNYGFQPYPKADVAYLISEEGFMPDFVSQLKVRAAVGLAGLSPGAFDQFRTFAPVSVLGDSPGVTPSAPGNPDLEPERSLEIEAGFEGQLFDERIFFDFTYFRQRTDGALVPVELPPSQGFEQPQLRNIGEIQNVGWELALDAEVLERDNFSWNSAIRMSGVRNEVKDLGESDRFPAGGGGTGAGTGWVAEGYPVAGIWEFEPVDYDPETQTFTPTDTLVYQGSSVPTFTGSWSNGFELGNFRFNLVVATELGAVFFNGTRQYQINFRTGDEYLSTLDANNNPTATSDSLYNYMRTFAPVHSRDHVRIQSASISYRLPESVASIFGLGRTMFTLSGQNLHWWDDANSMHPQVNYLGGSSFAQGAGFLAVPPPRQFRLSLRARF